MVCNYSDTDTQLRNHGLRKVQNEKKNSDQNLVHSSLLGSKNVLNWNRKFDKHRVTTDFKNPYSRDFPGYQQKIKSCVRIYIHKNGINTD